MNILAAQNDSLLRWHERLSRSAGALTAAAGLLVLAGWWLDAAPLKSGLPGLATMKANTALSFIFLGVALLSRQTLPTVGSKRKLAARACATMPVLLGLLTLAEYFTGYDLRLDELLFRDPGSAATSAPPGRMAHATALDMTMFGVAIWLLDSDSPRRRAAAQLLALAGALIGLVAFSGYLYGVRQLHGVLAYSSVSLHTATLFLVFGAGVLCARPAEGLMAVFTHDHYGGFMARRILPVAVGLPFVVGWLQLKGQQAGWYDTEFWIALFATVNGLVFAAVVWWSSRSLNRVDAHLRQTQDSLRLSEERLRIVTDNARVGLVLVNPERRYVFANAAYAEVLGLPTADIAGQCIADTLPEVYQQQISPRLDRAFAGERVAYELHRPRPEGEQHYAVNYEPIREGGVVSRVVVVIVDITGRKQAEQRIEQLNRTYAILSDINQLIVRAPSPQAIFDGACRIAVEKGKLRMAWIGMLDRASQKLTPVASAGLLDGYLDTLDIDLSDETRNRGLISQALLTGKHAICDDIEQDPRVAPWREAALHRGYRSCAAFPLKVETQSVGTFSLYSAERGFFEAEELLLLDELAMDIGFALEVHKRESVRRRAEATRDALLVLETKLSAAHGPVEAARCIFAAADQLWAWDAGTLEIYLPDQDLTQAVLYFDVVGGERREVSLLQPVTGPTPRFRRTIQAGPELILRQPPFPAPSDTIMFGDASRPSASIMWVPILRQDRAIGVLSVQSYTSNAFTEEDLRTLQGLADHCGGALERIRADGAMRASEERFRELTEAIEEVFWVTDPTKQQMLYISPAYAKVWGRSCESLYASPQAWLDAIHPEDRERVLHAAMTRQKEGSYDEEYRIVRPDGQTRWIRDRAFPVRNNAGHVERVVGVARDVTERRHLEEQFRQAQKMEAIGQLAGGVAHDFNNLLVVMRGYAEILLADPHKFDAKSAEYLREITAASERAANLIRQLLAFGRKQVMQSQALNLNEVIGNLTKMLNRIIGENIRLQCEYTTGLPFVRADVGMLEQVLVNLIVNARDAMPNGGKLLVATAKITLDAAAARVQTEARPGEFACLSVSDTGTGIAPEHLAHIFEPFYTTKALGEGTGLGLATVYGIVKQHQGWIEVASELGTGATFKIFLPVIPRTDEALAGAPARPRPPGGQERILLVEDELAVRLLTRLVLERAGYQVVEAASGREALNLWQDRGAEIHLLLTDMVMPDNVSGRELADRLRAQTPALKVIFMSGYSPDVAGKDNDFIGQTQSRFLQKPFSTTGLLQAVREVLDQ